MRRIVTILAFSLTLAAGTKAEDVSIKTIETIQKSVVPVLCMGATEKGAAEIRKVMGTGFLINREGGFLTAAHVVLGLQSECPAGSFWAIYVPTNLWKEHAKETATHWFRFDTCRYNGITDIAACKPIDNPFADLVVNKNIQPVRFGTFANHPDGSPVAFTGFPLESVIPITSKGFIATYFPREDWFGIDKSGWPGASGSPVYDQKGLVIGLLIRRTASDAGGLGFARPIDPILEFLAKEKMAIEK
jgi:S1-C subfamily serine protease